VEQFEVQVRMSSILICDDDPIFRLALKKALSSEGDVITTMHGDETLALLKTKKIDLLLLDISMRTEREGLEILPAIRAIDEDLNIVMLTGHRSYEMVRDAMKTGAMDYLVKDAAPEEIRHRVRSILETRRLKTQQQQQNFEARQTHSRHRLIGESKAIVELRRFIEKVAQSSANVLITGETGSGKEVVARLLRQASLDGNLRPFVAVDAATIHSQTAESILFGHEKGAFTGADKLRKGAFEEANGGIIYFDEIGNMPIEIQSKLLRVIQEKEIIRLGSSRSIPLSFRVIAATNSNLQNKIKAGEFKEDLLQRIEVIPIHIPPLRDRREDIPLLVEHFAKIHARKDLGPLQLSEESLEAFIKYDWPGNIRELSNLMAYLSAVAEDREVSVDELPPKIQLSYGPENRNDFYSQISLYEAKLLREEFEASDGNISKLATRLKMDRSHLYSKLKAYGIYSNRDEARQRLGQQL
jgi:DNA-binding NtrC family response regulator